MRLKIYPASLLEIHIKQERAEKFADRMRIWGIWKRGFDLRMKMQPGRRNAIEAGLPNWRQSRNE